MPQNILQARLKKNELQKDAIC